MTPLIWGLGYLVLSCLLALLVAAFIRVGHGPED